MVIVFGLVPWVGCFQETLPQPPCSASCCHRVPGRRGGSLRRLPHKTLCLTQHLLLLLLFRRYRELLYRRRWGVGSCLALFLCKQPSEKGAQRPCGTSSRGSEHLPRRAAPTRAAGAALLSGVCSPLIYLALLSGLYDLRNILFHHFYLRSGLNLQFETMDISMLSSQQATLIHEPQCRLEQGRRSGRAHAAAPRRALGQAPSEEKAGGRRPPRHTRAAPAEGRGAPNHLRGAP